MPSDFLALLFSREKAAEIQTSAQTARRRSQLVTYGDCKPGIMSTGNLRYV